MKTKNISSFVLALFIILLDVQSLSGVVVSRDSLNVPSFGKVYIYNLQNPDGMALDESYLPEGLETFNYSSQGQIELGAGQYFVLGDNRGSSKDSRVFGPVNKSFIIGRVAFRGWPLDKIGLIKTSSYQNN